MDSPFLPYRIWVKYIMRYRRNQFQTRRKKGRRNVSGGLSFKPQKRGMNVEKLKKALIWVGEIVLTVAIAAVLVFFMGVRISVVGQSMSGTLENGEIVLINRFEYKLFQPKPNDIIVFLPNGNEKSHYYIKRVIAVPGDTVQIIEGKVYVNEKPFSEEIENPYIENGLLAEEPILVGEDEYFVLGDNRNNSEDSRYANIGNVKKEHIEGKVWMIVSPLDKLGLLK